MSKLFSIQEIAELKLPSLPSTRQAIAYRAKKEQWFYEEVKGKGGQGGLKKLYQLPSYLIDDLNTNLLTKVVNDVPEQILSEVSEVSEKSVSKVSTVFLAKWQRDCAIARLAVVRHVLSLAELTSKTKAVEGFAKASRAERLDAVWPETVQRANAKSGGAAGKASVSRRTLFDWIGKYEQAQDDNDAVAELAPKARKTEMPEWAGVFLKLWSDPAKPELSEVMRRLHGAYADSDIELPSYHQARYFLNKHVGNVAREQGRMGSREIKNIKPFVRRDTSVLLPTDVYTADGHTFDAEVAHPDTGKPFRPEITTVLDVHTRMIVGYSVDLAESGLAVLDAISSAASDYGIPAIFYVDNGSGYKNAMMKDESYGLMTRLGVEVKHSIAYNSQARGAIERLHKSVWIPLARRLPTFIGDEMDRQAKQAIYKKTRKEIKEFGESKLLVEWNRFLELADAAVSEYNNQPHAGLPRRYNKIVGRKEHITPQMMWDEQIEAMKSSGHELVLVSAAERDDLYRPYVPRKCLRGEINLFNNKYFSKALEQYHGERMLVGYDIHDGSRVWVRDLEHRLVAVAEFEANKASYFAQSALDDAREKRLKGQLKRASVHVNDVLDDMNPSHVLEHVESQMLPETDINRAKKLWEERLAKEALDAEVVEYESVDSKQSLDNKPLDIKPFVKPDPAPQMPIHPDELMRSAAKARESFNNQDAETQDARFKRWLDLHERANNGEVLEGGDYDFYDLYPQSNIYKIKMKAYCAEHEDMHGTLPFFNVKTN